MSKWFFLLLPFAAFAEDNAEEFTAEHEDYLGDVIEDFEVDFEYDDDDEDTF